MKRALYIMLLALLSAVFGCSSDMPQIVETNKKYKESNRSSSEVLSIVSQFLIHSKEHTRTSDIPLEELTIVPIADVRTRGAIDTLIFAVNIPNDQGFLLISADKAAAPILGIVEDGCYSDNNEEDDAFNFFMDKAKDYVRSSASLNGKPTLVPDTNMTHIKMFHTDTIKSVSCSGNRIKVNWGPHWPENKYCFNKMAGYVPVGVAQMMSYFKDSAEITCTFEGRPYDKLSINWDKLISHKVSLPVMSPSQTEIDQHSSDCKAAEDIHDQLGVLCRQIGEWCNTVYTENGTTNDPKYGPWTKISEIFKNKTRYMVSSSSNDARYNIYEHLKDGGVGCLFGEDKNTGNHMWVIDGVGLIEYVINTYYFYNPLTGEYTDMDTEFKKAKYIHCNWGRWGRHNGYFLEDVYNTKKGVDNLTRSYEDRDYEYDNAHGYVYK